MLNSILSSATGSITIQSMLICTAASLALGIIGSLIYMYRNTYNKSFVITLALLPAMIQIVIMLVNGNLGTGVAVMGAFSLVRFRSVPGSAREIGSIFLAMAIGLATGTGYLGVALLFLLIIGGASILLIRLNFGENRTPLKELSVTIPEDLDYSSIFDDVFKKYTKSCELTKVKTTNLGSLFELRYNVMLKDPAQEKAMLDDIRCRNGNLNISIGRIAHIREEL